jgi:hypothetical protein
MVTEHVAPGQAKTSNPKSAIRNRLNPQSKNPQIQNPKSLRGAQRMNATARRKNRAVLKLEFSGITVAEYHVEKRRKSRINILTSYRNLDL